MPRITLGRLFKRTSRSWNINESEERENKKNEIESGRQDGSALEKLLLLLWKNYKIQVAHKIETSLEVILPVLFTIIIVIVRILIESKVITSSTIFPAFDVDNLPNTPSLCCNKIYFTPNNNVTQRLMRIVQQEHFNVSGISYKFFGFDTEKELEKHFANSSKKTKEDYDEDDLIGGTESPEPSSPVLAGIVFTNEFLDGGREFPKDIKYKLRFPASPRGNFDFFEDRFGIKKIWLTEGLYPVVQLFGPRAPAQVTGGIPGYYDEGFLYLQQAIDKSLAKIILPQNDSSLLGLDDYSIKLQRFPYPPYIDDKFLFTLQGILPIVLILSFIFPVINTIKMVIVEKERRLKEYMKMMGLPNWLHWTAWFIKSFTLLAISNFVITILLKIKVSESQILSILPNTSPSLIFFVLLTHGFQLVCFAFFISTLFKTANSGAIVGAILWFVIFIPYAFLQPRYNVLSRVVKILWCFGTNIGMCFSCQLICRMEGTGIGAQWDNLFQGATPDDPFCLGDCILVMFINGLIFLALCIYVEAVLPGEFGIPLPWYFLFTKWYWTGEKRKVPIDWSENELTKSSRKRSKDFIEEVPANSIPGIKIKGLTKKFGENKIAVKNLYLDLYENEIFVLLGHNAAGKTTTMSLLAGIFPPTSGTAVVNGYDICRDMKGVRRSLGLCPQTNVLFAELTVKEHLQFFSTLKGLKKSEVESEVNRMITAIGLEDKRNTKTSSLSGGMKRRLSVGIAFCGKSKVVLLDEPSSGLDPGARRAIWDLIQGEKKGRTVLLSTHYMDEADILADRIAIMAEGEVQCCGSSLFLKKKYGCGYHLVIVKEPHCKVENITHILKSKLKDVEEEQNIGAELSYALPENQSHLFAQVFEELESKKEELGIASYGASITTMEEIFMRVGHLVAQKDSDSLENSSNSNKEKDKKNNGRGKREDVVLNELSGTNGDSNREEIKKNSGIYLRMQQFSAMIEKKLVFIVRKNGLLVGKIAVPSIYLTLLLFVLTTIPGFHDPPPFRMALDDYELFGEAITPVNCPEKDPICQGYLKYLKNIHKLVQLTDTNETVSDLIIEKGKEDQPFVNFKYLLGFEERSNNSIKDDISSPNTLTNKTKTELIGYFNNQPMHTPPLALNYITNAILNSNSEGINYSVEITNHPFEYGISDIQDVGTYFTIGFQVGLHLSLAMGFMTGIYTIFPIKERVLGSKHLQFVSGANFIVFWVANFIVDLTTYILPCAAVHFILVVYQIPDFYTIQVQLYLLLMFYCYAWAVLPMGYLSSLFFQVPSGGLVGLGIFNVFTGFATIFVVSILENPELKKEALATTLHRIFLIFPTYSLGKGITQISVNHQLDKACSSIALEFFCEGVPESPCCSKLKHDYLDWEEVGIGKNLVYLIVFGIVSWTLLLLSESGMLHSLLGRFRQKIESFGRLGDNNNCGEDSQVHLERERIKNGNLEDLCKTDNLVIRDLTKVYPSGTIAVDRLSLGVKKGECFGLLGANGAGKTSTFKMLTGELDVTSGDAYIYSHCIRTGLKDVHKNMGYCPQFDSLIEEMTGRETLKMYCRLRGIPERKIKFVTEQLAEDLLFTQFLDKVVKSYSGGNKRKLSTAIALVGNPPIVFLDEPTCGIDPLARRHLWECIIRIRDKGTSVILTSHSMEETEFLCTRLAIMVNGKFRCLGSSQQLKSKFGEGYTLTCQTQVINDSARIEVDTVGSWRKLKRKKSNLSMSPPIGVENWRSRLMELRVFIEESLPGCTLEDLHEGFLHYRIKSDRVTWGQMFTVMEAAKEKYKIEAYSVGQTSLEQVFLNFTKAQFTGIDSS